MRQNIFGVSALLKKKTTVTAVDFRQAVKKAKENDLIYMDPPYQGTSFTRDHRYFNGLSYEEFVEALSHMNEINLSYIISYDGITGEKTHVLGVRSCNVTADGHALGELSEAESGLRVCKT